MPLTCGFAPTLVRTGSPEFEIVTAFVAAISALCY